MSARIKLSPQMQKDYSENRKNRKKNSVVLLEQQVGLESV